MIFLNTALAASPRYRQTVEEPPMPIYEAETTAFMNTAGISHNSNPSIYGITNSELWQAVDDFVLGLKGYGLLSKSFKIFMKLGDSASQAAIDLITLTSGSYGGGWIFDATGAKANGTNCYLNSGFNPRTNAVNHTNIGATISVLNLVNTSNSYSEALGIYTGNASNDRFQIYNKWLSAGQVRAFIGDFTGNPNTAPGSGIHTITRGLISTFDIGFYYINGIEISTQSQNGKTMPNAEVFEAASNRLGSQANYMQGTLGVSVYHSYLTSTEVNNLKNTINAFETAINRK